MKNKIIEEGILLLLSFTFIIGGLYQTFLFISPFISIAGATLSLTGFYMLQQSILFMVKENE